MWIKCFNSVKEFGWVAVRACNGEVIHNSRPDPFFSPVIPRLKRNEF
jgi:hypothetical protein